MGKLLSLDARGKFGISGAFGRIAFGYTALGFYSWWSGIYSKKYYFGKPYISRMKFYRPTNNRMLGQQNWRYIHAFATSLWQSLTTEEKQPFELKGKMNRMTGYNFFLSLFLKNPPYQFGAVYFGFGI